MNEPEEYDYEAADEAKNQADKAWPLTLVEGEKENTDSEKE